jgi:hypothetical protein
MPDSFASAYADLNRAVAMNESASSPPYNNVVTLTSHGGTQFMHFGKHRLWNQGKWVGVWMCVCVRVCVCGCVCVRVYVYIIVTYRPLCRLCHTVATNIDVC